LPSQLIKDSGLFPNQEGTYSWGGAFSTTYWVDPKEKMVVLLYRQMWGQHGSDVDETYQSIWFIKRIE
jgi:CubicO group peptidase (beta-lactamase class C family)